MTPPPKISVDSDGVEKLATESTTPTTEFSSDPIRGVLQPGRSASSSKRGVTWDSVGEICIPTAGAVLLLALFVGMGVYLNRDEPGTDPSPPGTEAHRHEGTQYVVILSDHSLHQPFARVISFTWESNRGTWSKNFLKRTSEVDMEQALLEGIQWAASIVPEEQHNQTPIRLYGDSVYIKSLRPDEEERILRASPFLKPANLGVEVNDELEGVLDWLGLLVTSEKDISENVTLKLVTVGLETVRLVLKASDCSQASLCLSAANEELGVVILDLRNRSILESLDRADGKTWKDFCLLYDWNSATHIGVYSDKCCELVQRFFKDGIRLYDLMDASSENIYVRLKYPLTNDDSYATYNPLDRSNIDDFAVKVCDHTPVRKYDHPYRFRCADSSILKNLVRKDRVAAGESAILKVARNEYRDSWLLGAAVVEIHRLEKKPRKDS